jgi:hypothetical protein
MRRRFLADWRCVEGGVAATGLGKAEITFIFQCQSGVHDLNIRLDVHAVNGLNRPEIEGLDGSPVGNGA